MIQDGSHVLGASRSRPESAVVDFPSPWGGQARGRLPISRLPEHSFATSPAVCVAAGPAVPLRRVQFSSDEGLFTAVS